MSIDSEHTSSVGACPLCSSTQTTAFYANDRVPVTCASVFDSREAALAVPFGALRLTVCSGCGFVFNDRFQPEMGAVSARYESSQAASAHFSAFARSLAQSWVARYGLRDRTVLEVGCGGADFLKLLVQEGVGRATGIDPCCNERSGDAIRLIADTFDERYFDLQGDALVCRHTLEHIADVTAFLGSMRKWCDHGSNRVLLFELPGSERVFAERAFWDVYYEHCSYFTAATVRFAFERSGFEVLRVEHAYNGQYLIVEAAPSATPTEPAVTDGTIAAHECQAFAAAVNESIDRFRTRACALAAEGSPLVLWQGASKTVGLLTALGNPDWIECAVDVSPHRHGKFLPGSGLAIYAPERLVELRPDHIILMNPVYLNEVQAQVRSFALDSQVHTINDLLA